MNDPRWALAAGVVCAVAAVVQVGAAWLTIGLAEEPSTRTGAGKMLWLGVAPLVAAVATAAVGSRLRTLPILTGILVLVSLGSLLFGTIGDATEVYGVELLVSFFTISFVLGRLSI